MAVDTKATRQAVEQAQKSADVAKASERPTTIAGWLDKQKPQIARALPRHIDIERFTRIALTTLRQTPQLQQTTPESFLGAIMLAAQLGLEPGPLGQAYIVPFNNKGRMEAQFIVGYKGYIDLARRSGQLLSIEVRTVYEADEFEYSFGLEGDIRHIPSREEDRGNPVMWYGIAKLKDGGLYYEVMSRGDIERYRKRSKAPNSPAWTQDYDAMAKKTVVRRMAPWLPMSVEAQQVAASDENVARLNFSDDAIDVVGVEVVDAETGEIVDETPADGDGGYKTPMVS
jgi:recombination protein RecT